MDSFLSDLYKESMEKQAGVELREFYDSLSIEQLEQVLGLTKEAVEGPACPECPDGSPVKKYLDATEKAPAKKTTPPELPTAASPAAKTSSVFDQLEGKVAADLTLKKRESLPAAKFAIPEKKAKKIGVAGEIVGSSRGKYPIPDAAHARNALARVAQHGTPAEKSIVQRKVHAKFPGIGEKNAEKRAELLITALRAIKDAPEYVKHAAAKYVGERL